MKLYKNKDRLKFIFNVITNHNIVDTLSFLLWKEKFILNFCKTKCLHEIPLIIRYIGN